MAAVLGFVSAGAAAALAIHPGAAGAEPSQACDQTMVVVEWHGAQNAPDKDLSAQCADPGGNPFDALKNAKLSPITQVESAVGTILCSILNVPAASCDNLPPHAAWTYWYIDPGTHQWQGPYTSPPDTSSAAPSPSGAAGKPGAATGPQPTAAPPVEDWVYQSNYPDHTVKPAYYTQGSPPSSAPSASASSNPQPTLAPSNPTVPSIPPTPRGTGPSLPAGVPHSHHSHTAHRSHSKSPRPAAHSSAATTTGPVDRADGFTPSRMTLPELPNVSPPDQWWIAADRSAAALTREGQASKTAWATAEPADDPTHRLAWSTGLGSAAVVLLGIGITAQLRRRRSS